MKNIGLKKGALEIMDYQNDYPAIYKKEKENLLKIYKDKINIIEHVGSTSIIGIKSKPIIDIMIETDDLDDFKSFTESISFEYLSSIFTTMWIVATYSSFQYWG